MNNKATYMPTQTSEPYNGTGTTQGSLLFLLHVAILVFQFIYAYRLMLDMYYRISTHTRANVSVSCVCVCVYRALAVVSPFLLSIMSAENDLHYFKHSFVSTTKCTYTICIDMFPIHIANKLYNLEEL